MPIPVIINAGGGSATTGSPGLRSAFAAAGLDVAIQQVPPHKLPDALRAAAEQAAAGAGLLVAGGGDGTLNCAAQAAMAAGVELGVLPMGTRNHFALDLGLPLDPRQAAAVLAKTPARPVDLGYLDDRPFLNNVSIGIYPKAVQRRDGLISRLGLPKTLAMALAMGAVLRRPRLLHITLQPDSAAGPVDVDTQVLFVGNNRYGASALAPQRRARLDEGHLLVLAPEPLHRLPLARLLLHAMLGQLHDSDAVQSWLTSEVEISVAVQRGRFRRRIRRLAVGMDGERVVLEPPFTLRCQPGALRVRAPEPAASAAPALADAIGAG